MCIFIYSLLYLVNTSESTSRPHSAPSYPYRQTPSTQCFLFIHEPPNPTPIGFLPFPFSFTPIPPSRTFSGTMFFDRYKEPTFFAVPTTFFFSSSSKAREAGTFLFCGGFCISLFHIGLRRAGLYHLPPRDSPLYPTPTDQARRFFTFSKVSYPAIVEPVSQLHHRDSLIKFPEDHGPQENRTAPLSQVHHLYRA